MTCEAALGLARHPDVDESAALDALVRAAQDLRVEQARHRQYEALRAYFVEHRASAEVARAFGYDLPSRTVSSSTLGK
ncbi:hypothetical protein [Sorangium sp. So ce1078]|uniref:hypothetical protein n=1 Tax=Sorangium sp. So ce1078 TaxID=3133329 RepID=UPI003F5EB1A3